jgi:hypothetical protein
MASLDNTAFDPSSFSWESWDLDTGLVDVKVYWVAYDSASEAWVGVPGHLVEFTRKARVWEMRPSRNWSVAVARGWEVARNARYWSNQGRSRVWEVTPVTVRFDIERVVRNWRKL